MRVGSGRLRKFFQSSAELLPAAWVATLGMLYTLWPTLLPDYLADALPAAVLLGGLWCSRRLERRGWMRTMSVGIFAAATVVCLVRAYLTPWTGMFTRRAVEEGARVLTARVPREEPGLTAALLIPYLTGHRVLFDIAHPYWYGYTFVPADVREVFLPPLAAVEHAVRERVRWVVVEHLTDRAYLRHSSNLLGYVWSHFQFEVEIPNETGFRSNPLLIWRRK
jgi:hypothetical protein